MNPNDSIEETLFEAARQLADPEAQAAYLISACGEDQALRQRIEELLRAARKAKDFFQNQGAVLPLPPSQTVPVAPITEGTGSIIGRYKLLQKIGEGGCGIVYMAEQEEPVRRRVALKVIKLGMDTKEVIARFEAERQALALMDHPNIAKVLDAGATDTGRPYFVMELVRGIKITDFCDENKLSTEERLKLFIQVCQAIQHAHQKGVIHRDIKPSNILVTINDGVPVPKVIDFGIAKATAGRLTDQTLFTAFEQFIGTPAYMSPEQAVMTSLDIDTRSDIYSLGVLLYELLTGRTPFDQKELLAAGLDEMRRTIREQEPPRPSTRLSTLAADALRTTANHRHTDAPKLIHLLRGDLDWIAMKCLEKDRMRRYETANALASDIQRHLSNEPVNARPPSTAYRFQKLVRRNKLAFAAAGAVAAALLIGLGVSTWLLFKEKATRERALSAEKAQRQLRERAETEAAKSQQVAGFLKRMLQGVGPSRALGRDTAMLREILDKTAESVGRELTNQPEVEIEVRLILAQTYDDLELFPEMEAMARQSLQLSGSRLGEESQGVAFSLRHLGDAQRHQRRLDEAEKHLRESLALMKKLFGNEHREVAGTLNDLALVLEKQGKLAEAETMQREVLAMDSRLLGNENNKVAGALGNLASTLAKQGKHAEAEPLHRESVAMTRKLRGPEHPDLAQALSDLANYLEDQGKLAEAEDLHREALAILRKVLGKENHDVAKSLGHLASVLQLRGKLAEAETLYREGLAMTRKLRGNEHVEVGRILVLLASLLAEQHRPTDAEPLQREALTIHQKLLGNEDRLVADDLYNLALLLHKQGRLADSEMTYREALAMRRKLLGNEHLDVAKTLDELAHVLTDKRKFAEAESAQREALDIKRRLLGNEHRDVAHSLGNLGLVMRAQGKLTESETVQREALAVRRKLVGDEHPDVATSLHNLALVLKAQGRLAEAEAMNRETLAMRRKLLGDAHPDLAKSLNNLANLLHQQQKLAEAETLHREALAMNRKLFGNDHPETASSLRNLADVFLDQGNLAEAESLLCEALALARKEFGNDPDQETPGLGVALHHLAEVLRRQNALPEARALAEEAAALYERHADWPAQERQHASRVLQRVLADLGDSDGLKK